MMWSFAPLSDRTPFTGDSVWSNFTVNWATAADLLERELYYLDAEDVVLEVDVLASAIRNDGQLRGDARVSSPGVRLSFRSTHGDLSYATDRFRSRGWAKTMRDSWRHNVYAIAKGLEALRLVDRYGIASHGEQYRGYLTIEATPMSSMTRDAAEQVLRQWSGWDSTLELPTHPDDKARLVKLAKAGAHPDRHDGDQGAWDSVQTALRVLGFTS